MKAMINKKYWIIFVLIITTLLISMTISNMADAEDNDVNLIFSENGESSPPIFDGDDTFLAPGITINKKFGIQNKTLRNYYIDGIKFNNFKLKDSNGSLIKDSLIIDYFCDKVKCKIEKIGWINNENIYDRKLEDIVTQDGVVISDERLTFSSGSSGKFTMELSMDNSADNTLQGLSGNVDIQIAAISKDNDNNPTGGIASLIKTDSFFDTKLFIGLGTLILGIGIVIRTKK